MLPESSTPQENVDRPALRPWCTPTLQRLNGPASTDKVIYLKELTITTIGTPHNKYKFGPGGIVGPGTGPS